MIKGIIYFIQPAELVNTNKFKIGCSLTPTLDRCNKGYKKGSRYITIMECYNPLELEKKIKDEFNNNFKLIAGNEFFEGDENIMLDLFLNIVKSNRVIQQTFIDNKISIFHNFDNNFDYNPEYRITLSSDINSLAKNFHSKYSKYFICSDVGNNIWWQFNNSKWYRIEQCILKTLLSEDYIKDYIDENEKLNIRISNLSDIDKIFIFEKKSNINKIIKLLKNNTFKNKIIDEIKGLFYDPYFKQIKINDKN